MSRPTTKRRRTRLNRSDINMKIEGTCPQCGDTVGVRADDAVASLFGDAVRQFMDKDGNAIICTACGEYVDPEDMEIDDR
jgi:transcription elongation factor Elf1